ncbi:hypothetical protein HDA32_003173 [Spinactinospora alkalitolerans]|uniref:Uncharacterized protein n=1 Tax=Spinactinospora alkalitolerans TaxID=687207 RepID=A0A852TZ36_9ACTN|nr:hypothetical protein [Spinactinospora alkalitolerans]NYE48053.1 hypothetical protein [Spinactinospora alkalitolerans]
MPSLGHEFPLDLIRHAPELAAQLLDHASEFPLPEFTRARCEAGDATTTAPPELRADSVVVLERGPEASGDGAAPVLAIVTECQTGHDNRKRFSWPAYVANLRARLNCPVVLLILTPTESLARWCATPIDLGGGYLVHRPLALGLPALKPVTDPEAARVAPEYAILAAAANHTEDTAVLDALLPALDELDESKTTLYSDYVLAALPVAARKYLEETVTTGTYEFKSEFVGRIFREGEARGEAKGEARGEAKSVLAILDTRGIKVSDDVCDRITSCTDPDQLMAWLRRAVTADRAEDVFG